MRKQNGFTLVEVLVSVALFSIVMVVALGSLVALSSAVRRTEALDTATNNLGAALDSMTRSIRTGTSYHCGPNGTLTSPADCPTGSSWFTFKDSSSPSRVITYCLSNPGATTCGSTTSCGNGSCAVLRQIDGGDFARLTAPEVNVSYLSFVVSGASPAPGDTSQPRLLIQMVGTTTISADISSSFQFQTSVTQRIYDQ